MGVENVYLGGGATTQIDDGSASSLTVLVKNGQVTVQPANTTLSVGQSWSGSGNGTAVTLTAALTSLCDVTVPDPLSDNAAEKASYQPQLSYLAKLGGGCKGDGTTDDTTAISAAMDAAHTAGKPLHFEYGNYICAKITKSYALTITCDPGTTVTVASSVTNGWLWTFQGSVGSHVSLTGNMALNSATLPVDTTGMSVGGLVLVGSSVLVPDEGYPATVAPRYVGQLSEVLLVDSGAQATLADRAYTAFKTTDSAFAAIVTPIVNPRVMGLSFVNPYRATKSIGFLYFLYAQNVEFDIRGDGASAAGVQLAHCYRVTGRSRHRNYRDDGSAFFGYGVLVSASTAHGQFALEAVGGLGNAFNTSGIDNDWGEPRDHVVRGTASGGTGGFSTHPAGRDITFDACHVVGIGKGFAFGIRNDGTRIVNCTVDGAGGSVWLFDNARNITIEGNKFREIYDSGDTFATGRAILFTQTAAADDRNIVIKGNEFDGVDRSCVVLNDNGSALSGVEIDGNHFKNFGRIGAADVDWSAVYSQAGSLTRCTITNNKCSDSQTVATSKYLFNSNSNNAAAVIDQNVLQDGIGLTTRSPAFASLHIGQNFFNGSRASFIGDMTGNINNTTTVDASRTDFYYLPLNKNITLAITNPISGATLELHINQDATGSRLVTWPAAILWPGGTAPTLTTTANKTDIVRLRYRGTNWYPIGAPSLNL